MSLEVFKKPSSIGIFTPMFLFYTCLPPFVFCYKNGLVIPMFSALMFLFLWQVIPLVQTFGHMEFVLKLADFAYLRQGDTTLFTILCHIATTFLVLSVQLAAIYFILLQLPLVSIARSAYSMPKIFYFYFYF